MSADPVLSSHHRERFERDGFVVVRGLCDAAEMQRIRAWIDEVAQRPEVPGGQMMYFEQSLTEPTRRILQRVEDFVPYHDGLEGLIQGPSMLGAATTLFGETAVLFKDKINFKLPGGSGFTPHQDQQAGWSEYASLFITAMLTIDATTPENGCLEMVAGHHRRGLIGQEWEPLSESDMAGMEFVPCPTEPGDAAFFDSFAPHRSAPNRTGEPRRVLYTTYNRLSEGDHRRRYYEDKRRSFPPDCERDPDKSYAFRV